MTYPESCRSQTEAFVFLCARGQWLIMVDMYFIVLSGAKYGGYGSFLPTYERSLSVLSTPKTPQGNCNTSRSPKSLMEEVYEILFLFVIW